MYLLCRYGMHCFPYIYMFYTQVLHLFDVKSEEVYKFI